MALDATICNPLPTGGYDDGIFVNPPEEDLGVHCPVCLLVLREPHLLACCGGHLCEVCMRRIKNAGNACPCCRDEDFNSLLNKEKRRVVHGLKVYCTNKDTGCTWTGELGEVERHLQKRCDYVLQDCPYVCGQSVPRHSIQDHTTRKCTKRPIDVQLECLTQDMMAKVLALETKYEEKVSILEEKIRQQDVKIVEQEVKLAKQKDQIVDRLTKQEAKLAEQEEKQKAKLTTQEKRLRKEVKQQNDALSKELEEKIVKQKEQLSDKLAEQEGKLRREFQQQNDKLSRELKEERSQVIPGNLKNHVESVEVASAASCTENIENVNERLQKIEDDLFFQTEIPINLSIMFLPSWQKNVKDIKNTEVSIKIKERSIKLQCSCRPARLRVEATAKRMRSVIASLHKRVVTFPPERKEDLQYLLLKSRRWLEAKEGEGYFINIGDNELDAVVYCDGEAKLLNDVCLELQSFIDNKEKKVQLFLPGMSDASFDKIQAFAKSKSVHIEEEVNLENKWLLVTRNSITLIGGKFDVLLVEDYIRSLRNIRAS